MKGDIAIRLLETLDEFRACQAVQKTTWDFPDVLIIPYTQLVAAQHNGGAVLGAFDAGRLVGFVFGFLARQGDGRLYLFSQRMGVLPECQGRGIGERLKWAQRAWALEQGLDRIVWTFDPLEPPNARLNLAKLGGVARRYERDIYGEHDSPLHDGLPTDRLVVDWEVSSDRVLARLAAGWRAPEVGDLLAQAGPPLNAVAWDERGLPRSGSPDLARGDPRLLVEIPTDWQGLRQADMGLALDWRLLMRRLFEGYFARGYAATDYVSGTMDGRHHNFYLMERQ